MDKKGLTILGILITLLFLVFFSSCITQQPNDSTKSNDTGPLLKYTEGKVLKPQPRGAIDPSFPRNPEKEQKNWSEMWSIKYAGTYDVNSSEEKIFPIELTNSSMIFVKVYFFGNEPEKLSAQLYQEGRDQPLWTANATMLRNSLSFISGQISITSDMIAAEKKWKIKLLNSINQPVSAEVMIGIVDLTVKPGGKE